MAPTRDREGQRRGWYYWLKHEAYLFFRPEAFGLFGWTEEAFHPKKGFDTKMVSKPCQMKKRAIPPSRINKGTQIGTLMNQTEP
jgi:hypothetical protein